MTGFTPPSTPTGHSSLVDAPPWHHVGQILSLALDVERDTAQTLLPEVRHGDGPGLRPFQRVAGLHRSRQHLVLSFRKANETARIHHAYRRRSRTLQQPPHHHLAELNIGRIRYEIDDPRMAGFTNNLALVNGIAERSTGFIWRYIDESGNATNTRPFADPRIIVNVSVWESIDALERFVWQTVHKRFHSRRTDWFEHFEGPAVALWWVPIGHRPSVEEAVARIEHLKQHGACHYAFDWQTTSL